MHAWMDGCVQLAMPAVVAALAGRLADEWWHLSEVLLAPAVVAAQASSTPLGAALNAAGQTPSQRRMAALHARQAQAQVSAHSIA